MPRKLLVVDDDPVIRLFVERYCRELDGTVVGAATAEEGLELLERQRFDVLITDIGLPGVSGEVLLREVQQRHPGMPVILITGSGSIDGAMRALRQGAFDYLTKPFPPETFIHRLGLALRTSELSQEVSRLRELEGRGHHFGMVTADPGMLRVLSGLASVAKTDASVVVYGESGTGKELMARAVHDASPRRESPFVSVNCATLPATLFESELFGHVKGAFTDAKSDRRGMVAEAEGGTLFLDEIGEVPLELQAKLLRFLQEREFKPVGGTETHIANVRLVSATHRKLLTEVEAGRFREDLYYRINVIPVHLPPLRERPGDIVLLAEHFLQRFVERWGRSIKGYRPETLSLMAAHPWPGNIRELMNRIQRMVVLAETDLLKPADWWRSDLEGHGPSIGMDLGESFAASKKRLLSNFERRYVTECLRYTGGNVAAAARRAGMDRKNLWQLMKKHSLDAASFRRSARGARASSSTD